MGKTSVQRAVSTIVGAGAFALMAVMPTAAAEPVWDIGTYDSCIAKIPTVMDPEGYEMALYHCCKESGGVFQHGDVDGEGKCVAPPAEPEGKPMPPDTGPFVPATGGVATDPPAPGKPVLTRPASGGLT